MNYEENMIEWKVGDVVIHDADAKKDYMLMKVIKIYEHKEWGKLWVTKMAFPKILPHSLRHIKDDEFENTKEFLHDPKRFGITPPNLLKQNPTS